MLKPKVSKATVKALKMVNDGLFPVWNTGLERFEIFWRDDKTGVVRYIMTVEDEKGCFAPIDNRAIIHLSQNVAWDCLMQYPHPNDTWKYMRAKKLSREQVNREKIEDKRQYRKKHYRREFKAALENAKWGRFSDAPKAREKKIISLPTWAGQYNKVSNGGIVIREESK